MTAHAHASDTEQPPVRARRQRRPYAKTPSGRSSGTRRPIRALSGMVMVGGPVAGFALPAYGAWQQSEPAPRTVQQAASGDAQSLVVASGAAGTSLARESNAATTQEEIDRKKAAEEAAARARASAAVAATPFDYGMVTPGTGVVRWPLGGPFTVGDRFGARGGAHMGTDMLAAGGTPVYAAVDGVVRISQDSYGAYGVAVVVESVINGQPVGTVYPHMRTGSRQVSVGQSVASGQLVGLVGSTGRSTANHLHFEVYIDGAAIDSLAWLQANAG
ncbi:hypothetical protein GCM10022200_25730 [Microbacterium awajiense]|uniref:M23ase beta-sheet core domain-containing protein n=1 Tax=Microbacterium awajiense TaxID=415214 RepID=A0ABP7AUC1_9MICO